MHNEQQHIGAVKSRTNESCLVAEPIVVIIERKETELSLADAVALRNGLDAAIARVSASEKLLKGDGENWNLAVIAKSGSGMSFPRSKLGDGKFLYIDGMPDAAMMPVAVVTCISNRSDQHLT